MLTVRGLSIAYGDEPVLEDVDLDVQAGQFVTLLGPSGSGKTSVLRAVTGLLEPSHGHIEMGVEGSEVGFLFQDDALLPWRTVQENISLGLRIRGASARDAAHDARVWLDKMRLDTTLGDRYPRQLSGGQRKRVAIAQVLALEPKLLLMDEPFASLDAIVRTRITEELLEWVEREHLTVLLVTHDLDEAISLSDVVYVLSHGPRAGICAERRVGIERPRHALKSKQDPRFGPLLAQLWIDLEGTRPTEGTHGSRRP